MAAAAEEAGAEAGGAAGPAGLLLLLHSWLNWARWSEWAQMQLLPAPQQSQQQQQQQQDVHSLHAAWPPSAVSSTRSHRTCPAPVAASCSTVARTLRRRRRLWLWLPRPSDLTLPPVPQLYLPSLAAALPPLPYFCRWSQFS
jgi:hypothetical protein